MPESNEKQVTSNVPLDKIVMPDFIKELRKSASSVFLAVEEDIAHDISGKLNKAARELEKMAEREKKCPTLAEAEARALVKALQEISESIGLDPLTATPRQTVDKVRSLVA